MQTRALQLKSPANLGEWQILRANHVDNVHSLLGLRIG